MRQTSEFLVSVEMHVFGIGCGWHSYPISVEKLCAGEINVISLQRHISSSASLLYPFFSRISSTANHWYRGRRRPSAAQLPARSDNASGLAMSADAGLGRQARAGWPQHRVPAQPELHGGVSVCPYDISVRTLAVRLYRDAGAAFALQ